MRSYGIYNNLKVYLKKEKENETKSSSIIAKYCDDLSGDPGVCDG